MKSPRNSLERDSNETRYNVALTGETLSAVTGSARFQTFPTFYRDIPMNFARSSAADEPPQPYKEEKLMLQKWWLLVATPNYPCVFCTLYSLY